MFGILMVSLSGGFRLFKTSLTLNLVETFWIELNDCVGGMGTLCREYSWPNTFELLLKEPYVSTWLV